MSRDDKIYPWEANMLVYFSLTVYLRPFLAMAKQLLFFIALFVWKDLEVYPCAVPIHEMVCCCRLRVAAAPRYAYLRHNAACMLLALVHVCAG